MRLINCPDCGTKLKIENIDIDYGMNSIFAASVVECSNCHNHFLIELQYDLTNIIISEEEV